MKYVYLVAFLTLILLQSKGQILVGAVAGPQVTWTRYDSDDVRTVADQIPLIRYHAGGSISFRVHDRFFLNTSVMYSRKGRRLRVENDNSFRNRSVNSYLDIPIVYTAEFKARMGKTKAFKYYVGIGPDVAVWLGGRGTLTTTDILEQGMDEVNYKVVFRKPLEDTTPTEMTVLDPNRVQLGINAVVGMAFEPLGLNKILVTLRYSGGHSFLGRGNGLFPVATDYAEVMEARNHMVCLSAAYMIDLNVDQRKRGKSTINKKNL